jgi:hypothetical protein
MTRKSMLCGLANQGSVYPPSSLFLTSHAQSDNHHNFRSSLGTFWLVSCSGGSWYGVELVKSLHTWKHTCVGRVRHHERKEREGELLAACCTVCVCASWVFVSFVLANFDEKIVGHVWPCMCHGRHGMGKRGVMNDE